MMLVFESPTLVEVAELRDILEQEGIPCTIMNENSYSMRPEGLIVGGDMPSLYTLNDNDASRAFQIKSDWQAAK
jgi:hypothetical protein